MERINNFLEQLYENVTKRDTDRVVPVIGDEGFGKSALMVEMAMLWKEIRGEEVSSDTILESIAWDREDVIDAFTHADKGSVIVVPDAPRVLNRKEAMHGDQKEIEKDLFDVRYKSHLLLLGFQSWRIIPKDLVERRAKNILTVPGFQEGKVHGYNRKSINKKLDDGEWPEPDLKDYYPDPTGLKIWDDYQEIDEEKKRKRMHNDGEDEDEKEESPEVILAKIQSNEGAENYVFENGGQKYIPPDEIALEYDISKEKAKKVKRRMKRTLEEDHSIEAIM